MNKNIFIMKEKYLEDGRKKNFAELSIKRMDRDLNFFFKFLGIKHHDTTDAGEITKEMVIEYRDYLETYKKADGKGLKRITKYNLFLALSKWFRFLEKEEYIFLDPMRNIEIPRVGKILPKDILTEEEIERLLKSPDIKTPVGIRDRCMLEILYGSAIRAGEISKLKMQDLDLEHCYLFITGKGRKDRVVPITKIARKFLKKYLEKSRPHFLMKKPDEKAVFLSSTGRPFNTNEVGRLTRHYRKKAEIKKPVSPHTLRHTCASHLIARGASVRYVQELLGHSQITTTQIYTHVMPVDLQRVYNETHPRCLQLQGKKIETDEEEN
jgi:integrase/recombinase XerD